MKRILPLVLTVLLLPALLAVPVMADEVIDSGWIDILDYGYAQGYNSNHIPLVAGKRVELVFNHPTDTFIYSYDILFRTDDSNPVIATANSYLTIVNLGNGLYRAYGNHSRQNHNAYFYYTNTDGTYIDILSLRASVKSFDSYEKVVSGIVYDYSVSPAIQSAINYRGDANPSGTVEFRAQSHTDMSYRTDLDIYSWQAMDYIHLSMSSFCSGINSVQVMLNGLTVPFEYNLIESSGGNGVTLYLIDLVIDCRGLNRSSGSNIIVQVTGSTVAASAGNFVIQSCLGLVAVDPPSPLVFWFNELSGWIVNQTSAITSSIATWGQNIINALGGNNDASQVTDNINSAVGELEGIQSVMDGVSRPDLNAIDFNVSGMLDTSAVAVYGNIFSTLIGNQYMTNILMIAFILAAASFLLFGRR